MSLLLRLALPEIVVALSGLAVLALDLMAMQGRGLSARWRAEAFVACAGCVGAALLLVHMRQDGSLNDAMLIVNPLTRLAQVVLLVFTIFTVLLSVDATFTKHVGEYLGIILFATSAMMVLVSTQNLLVIFASLELLSLSLYILTGFNKRSRQSAEAALKYFLFGGAAAAFLLFGISLLYGLSGSIELPKIAASVATRAMSPLSAVAIVMVVTGLGFKVAAAPFHLWAPDAYQGAPSPSAALIASGSKVAGFFVLVAMMGLGLSAAGHAPQWTPLIAVVAALSMIVGNLAAIVQSSVRRLLAYSAIGHAGYMLLGVLSNNGPGLRALLFYVITYALAALGAFGVLAALERERVDRLESFAGLSRRAPWISFCMLIFLLSLAGIPPLAGFFGKFYVFSSALGSGGRTMLVLVILAISMSAVSLYYYLKVLKQIYVRNEVETAAPIQTTFMMRVVVGVMALGVIWLGCIPGLLLHWISGALRAVGH